MLGHQNMQLRLMCLCLDMLLLLLNVCVWPLWWGWHPRLGSMATEFKYTRQTASAKVPLGTYCFYANKAGILETAEPFLTVRFPVLFSPQTNMFISATTWIPNNVLLQVHSRLPRDSRFAPDPRTTAPSQPGGHNLCTAKTCSQINAGMSRRTRNEDEWAQKAEKQRAGPVPATVLQRPAVQSVKGRMDKCLREPEAPPRAGTWQRFGLYGMIVSDWSVFGVWALYHHRNNLSTSCSLQINNQSAFVCSKVFFYSSF